MSASDQNFFIQESVRLARGMNIADARSYLRGLLEITGEDEATQPVRAAVIHLDESDRQLELIASAQRKLAMDGNGGKS